MTTMTIVDVVNINYPGQMALGNVTFGQDGSNPIFITKWTVPNVSQPTVEELEALIPSLQNQFDIQNFSTVGPILIGQYFDTVAQQRQYDSAVSCASYISSTNAQWKNEATVFISWRDSVFAYALAQLALMQSGQRTVPTFDEFKTELPVITWP